MKVGDALAACENSDASELELGRLRAAGEIDEAVGELSELPAPLNLEPDQKSPSWVLVELRVDER